jgi:small-conductance mechanosensitive channel
VIVGAHVISILLSGALNRAAERNATKEGDTAAESALHLQRYYSLAHRIVSILVTVLAGVTLLEVWGVHVIDWLSGSAIGRSFLSAFLTIAVAVLIAVVIWEAANTSVKKRLDHWNDQGELVRAARLRTLVPMMKTILFIAILLVVGLTALSQIGVNTTPLLASASIIGVAVGFGSQKLVQDFITGIFLLMENAMQVGDWVTVAGVSGTVEYLSIRTVRLRAGDGSLHIVPFSSVSTVNNTNRGLGNAAMRVSVSFGTDVDKAINELKQIGAGLRNDPAFQAQILGDIEVWGVDAVDGSTVTLAGQIRCTDTGRWGVQRELNRRILERFRELEIQIADPRTTLLLPGETVPPLTSAAQKPINS